MVRIVITGIIISAGATVIEVIINKRLNSVIVTAARIVIIPSPDKKFNAEMTLSFVEDIFLI